MMSIVTNLILQKGCQDHLLYFVSSSYNNIHVFLHLNIPNLSNQNYNYMKIVINN